MKEKKVREEEKAAQEKENQKGDEEGETDREEFRGAVPKPQHGIAYAIPFGVEEKDACSWAMPARRPNVTSTSWTLGRLSLESSPRWAAPPCGAPTKNPCGGFGSPSTGQHSNDR